MIQKTATAHLVWRKWSTWLALGAGGIAAYCGAYFIAFALLPEEARSAVPPGELLVHARLLLVSSGLAAVIPGATSIKQRSISQ